MTQNASPMTLLLGIQDDSTEPIEVSREQLPTHIPLHYVYAKKGPLGRQLVSGAARTQMYGAESFDMRKKWANHQTESSNTANAFGNAQIIERVLPADAGPKANMCLWLDLMPAAIPVYQRAADGSYVRDSLTNQPIPVTPAVTVPGFKAKWVVSHITAGAGTDEDSTLFGKQAVGPGDQTGGTGTSQRYPILEFWAGSPGAYANDAGLRIWAPTRKSGNKVNAKFLERTKVYPFQMSAVSRLDANSVATVKPQISGDTVLEFVLPNGVINPLTNDQISLADVFDQAWSRTNRVGFAPVYADIAGMHIYHANIETVLGLTYAAEQALVDTLPSAAGSDFVAEQEDGKYAFNFISGVSSYDVPYHTFVLDKTAPNAVSLTPNTNLFAAGGSDGTMSDALFGEIVRSKIVEYADENSELMDTAYHVETHFYDTGFPLATKLALPSFIAQRKDTFVTLSTFVAGDDPLTHSEEISLSKSLRAALELYPESSYFGTPITRGMIINRHGRKINTQYSEDLPLTLWLVGKCARMMGAGNGKWNKTYLFAGGEKAIIDNFSDINVRFVPAGQRSDDWAIGMNYPLRYDRQQFFFPALKTAYSDDTSVLTSMFTTMACCAVQRIGEQAWRKFSGTIGKSEQQLIADVNKFVEDEVRGKFADLVKVIPNCTITEGDRKAGFKWTLPISVYAEGMKTQMTLSVIAKRMSALQNP